jgi:hypothetical protein
MQLSVEVSNLLIKMVPRMTIVGEKLFREKMDAAVLNVLLQAFHQDELDAFHVERIFK